MRGPPLTQLLTRRRPWAASSGLAGLVSAGGALVVAAARAAVGASAAVGAGAAVGAVSAVGAALLATGAVVASLLCGAGAPPHAARAVAVMASNVNRVSMRIRGIMRFL